MSEATLPLLNTQFGTFDAEGKYVPRQITEDNMAGVDLTTVVGDTILEFDDGDLVTGTVVKIDHDEVLLDIGFKSEGVIPARELSIRNDVNPADIVSLGESIEALVLQKEDKEGRLVLSKKRAQYEKAWAQIEKSKEKDEVVSGTVDLSSTLAFVDFFPRRWWSCVVFASCSPTSARPWKPKSSSSTATATTLFCPVVPGSKSHRRNSVAISSTTSSRESAVAA